MQYSQLATEEENLSIAEKSEIGNISLLLFLYVLQGIPLGLSASIPMILQNRQVSYKEQVSGFLVFYHNFFKGSLDIGNYCTSKKRFVGPLSTYYCQELGSSCLLVSILLSLGATKKSQCCYYFYCLVACL